MIKKGILLINVGSPRSPDPEDVGKYLKEFLMDPEIISLAKPLRYLLVHHLIVPKRKFSSAEKYQLIWTDDGSPLVALTRSFASKFSKAMGSGYEVAVGMRYGSPSIPEALESLRSAGVDEILVCPMFPQYARATVASGDEYFKESLRKMGWKVPFRVLPPFYDKKGFIDSFRDRVRETSLPENPYFLFSFHGLPEKQIRREPGCLLRANCCDQPKPYCYRSQSLRTARLLASSLGLTDKQWTYSFQSRLGRAKWIGPSTEDVIQKLKADGIRNIVVVCPSFVTDCLETLEEIGTMSGVQLIPCPNDSEIWVERFAEICWESFGLDRPAPALNV